MKKIVTTVVAAIAALVFGGSVYAQDQPAVEQAITEESIPLMRPYDFFFEYLPIIANAVGTLGVEEAFMLDPSYAVEVMPSEYGFKAPFSASDIRADKVDVDSIGVYVWAFPEPEEMPLCKYVAFVPVGETLQLFTLEKSFPGYWMFCTVVNDNGFVHSSLMATDKELHSGQEFIEEFKPVILDYLEGRAEAQATFSRPS